MKKGQADTLTINVAFRFIAGAAGISWIYVQSKGFINIVWPVFTQKPPPPKTSALFWYILEVIIERDLLPVTGEGPIVTAAMATVGLKAVFANFSRTSAGMTWSRSDCCNLPS